MGKLTLLLGGARSGKSSYAEKRAKELGGDNVLYVATSETKDEEMVERVIKHRSDSRSASKRCAGPSTGSGHRPSKGTKRRASHFAGLHHFPGR